MIWLGYAAFIAAFGLALLDRGARRRHLDAFVGRYRKDPGWSWVRRRDADPEIERLRIRRLTIVVPELALYVTGLLIIATNSGRAG